jgi:hypothetical protein
MKRLNIKKVASIEDQADCTFSEIFEFRDIHGQRRRETIPRSSLTNPSKVRDFLYSKGFPDTNCSLAEFAALVKSPPRKRMKRPKASGWQNDTSHVSANGVLGEKVEGRIEWAMPSFQPIHYPLPRGPTGDVVDWVNCVAFECLFSSAGTVAICAGFGAILLRFVDGQSFIINLHGPSKSGKSTILLAAASIIGVGKESELPNFKSTESAVNELLMLYNDLLLPMNESGLLSGGRTKVYSPVRDLSYSVAEGRGKILNARSPYANAAAAGQFKTIVVMTAERSMQQYSEDAGAERDGGEFARIFDLDVRRGADQSIFDLAPLEERGSNAVVSRCRELREAISRHHGVALPVFIDYLVSLGPALRHRIRDLQNEFVASIDQSSLPDAAWGHACQSFGMLFAGGVLAAEAYLLQIEPDDLKGILGAVFRDAAKLKPPKESPADMLGGALRLLKEQKRLVKRSHTSTFGSEVAGFWQKRGKEVVFQIHSARLRESLGSDARLEAVLRYLCDRKAIRGQKSSKAPKTSLAEQCTVGGRWPDGSRYRTFKFVKQTRIKPRGAPVG